MKQLEFSKIRGWGGKRKGAGRPNRTGQVGHGKRPIVDFNKPLHITIRLKQGVASLRRRSMLKQFKLASSHAKIFGLHVIHFSLLNNHIHMIVEAKNNLGLSRGMKSLNCRLGKAIRRDSGGQGATLAGRFHLHVLKTPTEMKHALEYVLLNKAKHQKFIEHIDDFSSGYSFQDWKRLIGTRFQGLIASQIDFRDEGLSPPRSWLCRVGWTRAA